MNHWLLRRGVCTRPMSTTRLVTPSRGFAEIL
jgi:hypothetical protein